jgi:hypothetical protein
VAAVVQALSLTQTQAFMVLEAVAVVAVLLMGQLLVFFQGKLFPVLSVAAVLVGVLVGYIKMVLLARTVLVRTFLDYQWEP